MLSPVHAADLADLAAATSQSLLVRPAWFS